MIIDTIDILVVVGFLVLSNWYFNKITECTQNWKFK